jgi:hypothetical protein
MALVRSVRDRPLLSVGTASCRCYGHAEARPAWTIVASASQRRSQAQLEGEVRPQRPLSRTQRVSTLRWPLSGKVEAWSVTRPCWWRWGNSNSTSPVSSIRGQKAVGQVTCGFANRLVSARARCCPRFTGRLRTQHGPTGSGPVWSRRLPRSGPPRPGTDRPAGHGKAIRAGRSYSACGTRHRRPYGGGATVGMSRVFPQSAQRW